MIGVPLLLAALFVQTAASDVYRLRAVVHDAKGVPVRDLDPTDVSLQMGGQAVPIERFELDERPLHVALVVDSSQPIASHYRLQLIDAARTFVGSLPEGTKLSVWTTGDRPTRILESTKVEEGITATVMSRLERVIPMGGNTILDALVEVSKERSTEGGRPVLVFISCEGPGFANDAREIVVDQVMKTGVEVMGVLASERGESSGGGDVAPQDYDYVFGSLTERTGGRLERSVSSMGARTAIAKVAADLRSTYRLSYFQASGAKRSRATLDVARPSVKVRLSEPRKETSSP